LTHDHSAEVSRTVIMDDIPMAEDSSHSDPVARSRNKDLICRASTYLHQYNDRSPQWQTRDKKDH